MTGIDRKLSDVARGLVRLAGRALGRHEFFREASALVAAFAGADHLRLWLEEGRTIWRWSATVAPAVAVTVATSVRAEQETEELLTRVLAEIGAPEPGLRRGPAGALWYEPSGPRNAVAALFPFEISVGNRGVLHLVSATPATHDRLADLGSLAEGLGAAVAARRAQVALKERVKELTCMYRIAQIGSEAHLPLADTLQEIAELLPAAWQFPARTSARVVLGDESFSSPGLRPSQYRLATDVLVRGARRGTVEVFYSPEGGASDPEDASGDWPFLAEERHLIEGVAREIGFIVERKWFDEENDKLQEQLRHADRLATIGQLAAGIAHELNEPLGNILGFAQLLQSQGELRPQAQGDVRQIVTASLYAREVIRKLMLFARQTPPQRGLVQVNDVVADALALVESRCRKGGIEVERALSADLPALPGDAAQIQQVVVNLLVNAIHAMPSGGRLRLATERRPPGVAVLVEDTGVGIPAENLEKIFMPFFTTKEVGQGTGLGLAVVHGIVTSHGGAVRVASRPERGTRIEVVLPAQEGSGDDR